MNFNGPMTMPRDISQFSGTLSGSGGKGQASGVFVKGNDFTPKTPPPGVIGNFGVSGTNYHASGIFGGKLNSTSGPPVDGLPPAHPADRAGKPGMSLGGLRWRQIADC